jgi:hypothetical protein
MKRQAVNSSSLFSVGYDEAARVLEIEFHSGEMYRYFDVPPIVVRDLLHANSIGHYFAHFVKHSFRWEHMIARPPPNATSHDL